MSNRIGKREREARRRHKRCRVTAQIAGVGLTLKLGRKKCGSFMMSKLVDRRRTDQTTVYDYMSPPHTMAPWAVPVADSRTSVKTDEGDTHVSEPVQFRPTEIKFPGGSRS